MELWIVQLLFGAVMTGAGFWLKSIREDLRTQQALLQKTREEYVHKNDMRELKTEMSHRFDKLEDLIRDKKE